MISNEHFAEAAAELCCEPEALKAVYLSFSYGRAFRPDGRCRINFQGQLFWKELLKAGIDPLEHLTGNEDILQQGWNVNYAQIGMDSYTLLNKARQLDEGAALRATCWGGFQLAGLTHEQCGYLSVKEFVIAMHYEENQLGAFVRYLQNSWLVVNLQNKDWRGFSSGFNGPDYHRPHMAVRLRRSYHQVSGILYYPENQLEVA